MASQFFTGPVAGAMCYWLTWITARLMLCRPIIVTGSMTTRATTLSIILIQKGLSVVVNNHVITGALVGLIVFLVVFAVVIILVKMVGLYWL